MQMSRQKSNDSKVKSYGRKSQQSLKEMREKEQHMEEIRNVLAKGILSMFQNFKTRDPLSFGD